MELNINLPKKESNENIISSLTRLNQDCKGLCILSPKVETFSKTIIETTTTSTSLSLPYANDYRFNTVVYNNEIHLFYNSDTSYAKYHRKFNGSSWVSDISLPYDTYCNCDPVVYNNVIYALFADNKFYKFENNIWTQLADFSYDSGYIEGSLVEFNGTLYIYGGRKKDSHEQCYWTYNISRNRWTSYNGTLAYAMRSCIIVKLNNVLYALGGDGTISDDYDEYFYKSTNGYSWTSVGTLPFRPCAAVVYNGEIHILGAHFGSSSYRTAHYKWTGTSWVLVSTLPYPFYDIGKAVVFNDKIHILGSSASSYIKSHYVYDGSSWSNELITETTTETITEAKLFKYYLPKNSLIFCDKTALAQDIVSENASLGVNLTEDDNGYIVSKTGNVRLLISDTATEAQKAHSVVIQGA